MTPAELAARVRFTTQQLVLEANHARNPLTANRLRAKGAQLLYRYAAAYNPDPSIRAEVARLLEEAIDDLVDVITNSEPGLAEGAQR